MRSTQRPLQLLDPFFLLDIGLRGCASPPQRSLGSRFHFILPAVIEIGSDLVLAAGLSHVAALQTFQHNLPLLFWSSLDSRLSRHSRLPAEAPSLTNFPVQFYWVHYIVGTFMLGCTFRAPFRAPHRTIRTS